MAKKIYLESLTENRASLWKNRKPILSKLDFELTERCNNNCIHCYINLPATDQKAQDKELSTGEVKEILEEAASSGCLVVKFSGGEPLLREDFEEIYIFSRRLGFMIILFTNATLITPHLAELFAQIPPLEKVEISLYGIKQESYEAVTRVPGSFRAAMRGVNLLLENKVSFVVKSALLPPNKSEIKEFEAWVAGIPIPVDPVSHTLMFDLRCRRDSEEKNAFIKSLRLLPDEFLRYLINNDEKYFEGMKEFCYKFCFPCGNMLFSCEAGKGSGCVDAYGHFQLCMLLRHPDTVYDLKGGFLKDALMNFFPKIRMLKSSNPEYLGRCARCFIKSLCEQCPAKSWMEHGTLDGPPEYLCQIAHIQAEYLGLLKNGEKAWNVQNWKERIAIFSGKH